MIPGLDRYQVDPEAQGTIDYLEDKIHGMDFATAVDVYRRVVELQNPDVIRALGLHDRFFLLGTLLGRNDVFHPWLYDRCRELEAEPNDMIDLWAREHYKSTLITFAGVIQEILRNPEITVGIFSHTRPIAKQFLRQIKTELETNEVLKAYYSDVLYQSPRKEAPKWSEDDGLQVRRSTNPKEQTVESWGLVDGQPTSKHFALMVYDDVVTMESVNTPEMIEKTTSAWEMSRNLAAHGGRKWHIGTRYVIGDTYRIIMDRGSVTPRLYPATEDGTEAGVPVFLTPEQLAEKRRDMGPYTFAAQMLQNPTADRLQGFDKEWLKFWRPENWLGMNRYILCDPAGAKKKGSDYTVFWVWGLAADGNYYTIDIVRDRMNLTERTKKLFELHRQYTPRGVGYERYGKDSDIEHIESVMGQDNYRFTITPLGGRLKKEDRIRRLVPLWEQGRIYLPESCIKIDYQGKARDLVRDFIADEYLAFPGTLHDDMLDSASRIMDKDMHTIAPRSSIMVDQRPKWMQQILSSNRSVGWMAR